MFGYLQKGQQSLFTVVCKHILIIILLRSRELFLSALLSQLSLQQHRTGTVPTLLHWPQIKATLFFVAEFTSHLTLNP